MIPLRPEFAGHASRPGTARPAADDRGKTCKPNSPTRWWLLPVSVVLVFAVFGIAYYPVVRVQYRENRERARLAAELQALQARNARLDTEVARLRTPEGVEDYARTQLGLVKRGEHVVVVRDAGVAAKPAASAGIPEIDSDRAAEDPVGPWTGFLDLVFGVQ